MLATFDDLNQPLHFPTHEQGFATVFGCKVVLTKHIDRADIVDYLNNIKCLPLAYNIAAARLGAQICFAGACLLPCERAEGVTPLHERADVDVWILGAGCPLSYRTASSCLLRVAINTATANVTHARSLPNTEQSIGTACGLVMVAKKQANHGSISD